MSFRQQRFLVFCIAAIIAGFTSCRTGRDLSVVRLKPMSTQKLLNQAEQNAFDFTNLTIRRINVQFSNGCNKTNFRLNLKATRNEKILASISKLNIPVGSIQITPDSVKYVNYIDKNYFEGDYSYISRILNFDLNFKLIHAVIVNPLKTGVLEGGADSHRFDTTIEDGRYVLTPVKHNNRYASGQRRLYNKNSGKLNYNNNDDLIVRKLMFNPYSFALEKLVMNDPADGRELEVNFGEFEKVDGFEYPGAIDVRMISDDELTELNIRLNGFSTEKIDTVNLKVPGRYQRLRAR